MAEKAFEAVDHPPQTPTLCEICGRDLEAEPHTPRERECLSDGYKLAIWRAEEAERRGNLNWRLAMAEQKMRLVAEKDRDFWRTSYDAQVSPSAPDYWLCDHCGSCHPAVCAECAAEPGRPQRKAGPLTSPEG